MRPEVFTLMNPKPCIGIEWESFGRFCCMHVSNCKSIEMPVVPVVAQKVWTSDSQTVVIASPKG
jgi:hypothetical protein